MDNNSNVSEQVSGSVPCLPRLNPPPTFEQATAPRRPEDLPAKYKPLAPIAPLVRPPGASDETSLETGISSQHPAPSSTDQLHDVFVGRSQQAVPSTPPLDVHVPKKDARGGRRPGLAITARDLRALDFVDRFGPVTFDQISRYLGGMRISNVRARFAKMQAEGLVIHRSLGGIGDPCVVTVTKDGRGLVSVRTPLNEKAASRHGLIVTEVALELMAQGWTVLAERELRYTDQGNSGAFTGEARSLLRLPIPLAPPESPVVWRNGQPQKADKPHRHTPDLIAYCALDPSRADKLPGEPDHRIVAVEVELSSKQHLRWFRLMHAYRRDPLVTHVLYVTDNLARARALRWHMDYQHVSGDVRVIQGHQDWFGAHKGMPGARFRSEGPVTVKWTSIPQGKGTRPPSQAPTEDPA